MKNKLILIAILIATLNLIPVDSISQGNYTITNSTNYHLWVEVTIADDPMQCNFYLGLPTRIVTEYPTPSGCTGSQLNIGLMPHEWVYKVVVLEYSNCPTACTTSYGYLIAGNAASPCSSNPDIVSLSGCSSLIAEADRTSYCNIY